MRLRFPVCVILLSAFLFAAPRAGAQSATPSTLFFDDFAAGHLDTARWSYEKSDVLISRTRLGNTPTFGRDSDGTTWMRVPLDTYSPDNPGAEAKGTELFTRDKWNLNAGVEYEARIRFPATAPGWVGGFFSYSGVNTYPDTYQQAEGDFEFLTNQSPNSIWTNIWDDWNPLRGGPRGDLNVSIGNINWRDGRWHVFKMRWEPTQTTWFIDGQLIRTETKVLPGGAQGVRFNAWLADPYWGAASNASFVPAPTAAKNQRVYYDVDSLTVRALPNPATGPYGTGTGLSGTYFGTKNLTNPLLSRVDSRLNFDWGTYAPDPALPTDGFSVRWDGQIQARWNETYTFSTTSDDGVRVWVNGVQLINAWYDGGNVVGSGSIALKAGQKVPIRIEYYDNTQGANIRLRWSSPSTPLALVPQSQLYPTQSASAATPTFSPPAGTYSSEQDVAISSPTAGATIYYTLNGSVPTNASASVSNGRTVHIANSATLRAFASASGFSSSAVASASYIINKPLAVAFSTPAANASVSNLNGIAGTATSAARVDFEIKRLSDGKFWNGWEWLADETAIPTLLSGTSWKVVAPASNGAGLPSGANLTGGAYQLEADAYDASGAVVIATRGVSVSSVSASSRSAGAS